MLLGDLHCVAQLGGAVFERPSPCLPVPRRFRQTQWRHVAGHATGGRKAVVLTLVD